jgi:hypothetical protein
MRSIGKGIELWRDDQCIYLRDDKHNGPPTGEDPPER